MTRKSFSQLCLKNNNRHFCPCNLAITRTQSHSQTLEQTAQVRKFLLFISPPTTDPKWHCLFSLRVSLLKSKPPLVKKMKNLIKLSTMTLT